MGTCLDLYFLSTIACKLSECLSEEELEQLAVYFRALGEMLEVGLSCQKNRKTK